MKTPTPNYVVVTMRPWKDGAFLPKIKRETSMNHTEKDRTMCKLIIAEIGTFPRCKIETKYYFAEEGKKTHSYTKWYEFKGNVHHNLTSKEFRDDYWRID